MKIKIIVAFALFIVTFLIISIFLMNFLKAPVFVYFYFIFVFFLLIAISFSLKKASPENIKISFLIIMVIFIAFSLTFFGSNVKNYYEKNKEINDNLAPNSQIANLEKTNEYYISYMDFLNSEILKTKQASLDLQTQIDNLIAQQNTANQIAAQIPDTTQDNTPIILYEENGEEEYEEEND